MKKLSADQLGQILELKGFLNQARPQGYTRAQIAEAMNVTKPTVTALLKRARAAGLKYRRRTVRQGSRGPEAFSYYLKGGC